jgi:hypothetical protein
MTDRWIELRVLKGPTLRGWMLVVFRFLSFTIVASEKDSGMHLTLGVGASKLEATFGLSLWNQWLIP